MPRLPNGLVVFMRDQVFPGNKWIDMLVTNTFPIISIRSTTYLVNQKNPPEILTGYDHVSVPADLRLHITGPNDHIIFNASPLWKLQNGEGPDTIHYFSIVSPPAYACSPLVDEGETKTWHQAAAVLPAKDEKFSDLTRFFLDFFIHRDGLKQGSILEMPFANQEMRLASDNSGSLFGPFNFSQLQRKYPIEKEIFLTMRFGYVESEDKEDTTYIYAPLDIFQRRPKVQP